MPETTTVQTEAPLTWGQFKSYDEANRSFVLPDEGMGYVLRIESMSEPALSPFKDFDDNGKEKKPGYQTMVTFTIVDYMDDDPANSVIGATFTQYMKISLNSKATFYKMAKAAFGGNLDPSWSPNDELEGMYVGATIKHKDPNDQGQVYPKVDSFVPNRSRKDFSTVAAKKRDADATGDNGEVTEPPF